ncbi:MAG: 16S rRNA (guanine(966)-N(2))-methyltransferase RsmD [Alphaproteobacteria bacterium]|nr:16S rRNA (guanine(966)-N(2))-methyltransferase RsmD [Alphaproteobacteria bacterium]
MTAIRIISGKHRGRLLKVPQGSGTRPTASRAREAIFNILSHGVLENGWSDTTVLDLCCGTGAMGFEALSRGAARAFFIDNNKAALAATRQSAALLKEESACSFLHADAQKLPDASAPCDVIFFDPPYEQGLIKPGLHGLLKHGWLAPGGCIVVEQSTREALPDVPSLTLTHNREYGVARVLVMRK